MKKMLTLLDFTDDDLMLLSTEHYHLVIAVLAGETYKELASNFGLPVGTVKSRLFRAKAKLLENRKNATERLNP